MGVFVSSSSTRIYQEKLKYFVELWIFRVCSFIFFSELEIIKNCSSVRRVQSENNHKFEIYLMGIMDKPPDGVHWVLTVY